MEKKHLTREECFALLEQHKTPPHVVRHCVAVTLTALKTARALNDCGYHLNLDLIQAAGLIHDIARVEDKHWEKGAEIAENLGYPEEAQIIKKHMFYDGFSDIEEVNETDLVCLGDRLVKEDKYVGLDERMDYIIQKARSQGNIEAEAKILERKKDAQRFIDQIEAAIGMPLDQLMEQNIEGIN